jgi:Predicted Zn-dependent hydrolases of the beta-lactamase fold
MKITKYPQSCLFIETNNIKILVDAGGLKYKDEYFDVWKDADLILLTHKHGDHVYADVLKNINTDIYSTNEVQQAYPELKINIIKENDIFSVNDIKIEVTKAIHGYNPNLKDGKEVFENVGYIIDDGNTRLYITSDTICFNNDYRTDIIACPVTAHGLTMSSYEAALLTNEMGASLVLPIHMDNDMYPTDLDYMKLNFEKFGVNYKVLEIEESIYS